MKRMLLLVGALFLLPACDDTATNPDFDDVPDDQSLTGSYSLTKFNGHAVPVIIDGDACDEDGTAEKMDVRGGTAVFTAGFIIKVDLNVLVRCGSEGGWETSDETKVDLKYVRTGKILVLSQQFDDSGEWYEIGTATLSPTGIAVTVKAGEHDGDEMKLEFKKD